MSLAQAALTISSLLLAMTMCVHSAIGQRRLVRPLLDEGAGVMTHPLARFIVPFAWHLTSGIGMTMGTLSAIPPSRIVSRNALTRG